jgi:hypothetical protein
MKRVIFWSNLQFWEFENIKDYQKIYVFITECIFIAGLYNVSKFCSC